MNADRAARPSPETVEEEYAFSLADILQVIRRRLWVIALTAVVCAGATVGISLAMTPQYEGTIKLLVGQEGRITEDPAQAAGMQQLTQTVAEMVNTRTVAAAVIRELGLNTAPEDFLENLSVEQVPNTQVIQVSYRDPDPQRAQLVANTIGDVFSKQVSEVSPNANAITATVWEQAVKPDEPVIPDLLLNGILALVLGLMLGTGIAFLLEYLDDSWHSPEEAEQISGVPTFGMVPEFDVPESKKGGR